MPLEYTSSNQRIAVVIKATQMVIVRAPLLRCYSSLRVEQKRTQSNPSLSCGILPLAVDDASIKSSQTATGSNHGTCPWFSQTTVCAAICPQPRTAWLAAEQKQTEQAH